MTSVRQETVCEVCGASIIREVDRNGPGEGPPSERATGWRHWTKADHDGVPHPGHLITEQELATSPFEQADVAKRELTREELVVLAAEREAALRDEQERHEQLSSRYERLAAERNAMEQDRDAWRVAHLDDPEAEALAGCVRALRLMEQGGARAAMTPNRTNAGYDDGGYGQQFIGHRVEQGPLALDHPVGRILLALAARWHLPIEATQPPQYVRQGGRLIFATTPELADEIERLIAQYEEGR